MKNAKYKISTEHDGKPRKLYEKFCKLCSSSFWVPKHHFKKRSFCSSECAGKSKRKRVTIECNECGKIFECRETRIKNSSKHGRHFCSRKCKDTAQSLVGSSPEIRPTHYGNGNGKYSYRNHLGDKCVGCGESRDYLLVVHHRDGNRENNILSNLETVCFNCHAIRHLKQDKHGKWRFWTKALTSKEDIIRLSR